MLTKTIIIGLFALAIGCNQPPAPQNINIEIPQQKQVQPNPPLVKPEPKPPIIIPPIIIPPPPHHHPHLPPPHPHIPPPPHKKDRV